ncbi:flagellar hook-length control protein FliK [Maritalea mediterranea]|uniref:Flagellar hook-length control protein FliK n=1 Tax=Maritalea mediterranea TaxID=2909667 RepID=A0ABS9EDC1_9HYPH|nr:flagellar hook-length control protein FliK [Maritalea mediterranea]MCF4099765.1 flagellar hook-length control protein FliK [Maritalea mediterranea]
MIDFLGGKMSAEASMEGEGSSGFEAILGALMGGDKSNLRAAVSLQGELGPLNANGELALDTAKIKAALEKLKEALEPLAAAFDALLVPDPQQINKAQEAFAELAATINNHPKRYDVASTLPMGMFADQFGALRQAEGDKGPGNLMQLGKLLSRLDTLLGDFTPQMPGQKTSAGPQAAAGELAPLLVDSEQPMSQSDNAKLSLNIQQMMERLDKLSEKLPEPAQAAIAKLIDKKTDQLAGLNGNAGDGEANGDPMAKLLTGGEIAGTKKALQNGSSSNLINAALESGGGEQKAEFGQSLKAAAENKLMADQRYTNQQAAANFAQSAKLASELDTTETATDKILNLQRSEQQQQTHIQIDRAAHQQAPQKQINLPAMAFEVVRQIRNGAQRFEIRLDPPEMGKIDVQLEMDGKNVTARLTVERAETLDLLQRDQRALERALQQAGLNTDKANLQFSLKDQNDGQGQQPGQQEDGQLAGLNSDNDAEGATTANINDNPSLVLRGTARPDGLNLWV